MTHDTDTPDHIEHEIEKDREALRRTLDDLQGELSLDGLSRRLTGSVRQNGADWAEAASTAARANPVALGLTGIGLAWLIFGRGHDPVHRLGQSSDDRPVRPDRAPAVSPRPAAPAPARAPRPVAPPPGWASDHGPATTGTASGQTTGPSKEHGMMDRTKETASHLRDRLSDGTSGLGDQARHLRDRLSEGTEGLGDEARRRVETARHKALDASDAARRQMSQANRQVARSYDSEPLLFGALALIGGAALGALLPGTRREDELLGEYRDQLFDEAEAVYHEEKSRVTNAVSAGLDEAKSAASDVVAAAKDELTEDTAGKAPSDAGPSGRPAASGTPSTLATTGATKTSGSTGTSTV
ncbi:DUF3618 domain-containing protein [Paracoccus gahaiensis]|uniref:DUF3618 domain-containing protein n=1 Tax=Paracoccus gahaiensis TaxID=1706839 RepID=A0A4U0R9Y5_9RHOB|nr:DUF3618 domain-containing protein [Paracoccus gahaiensis]TJZ92021.1 DUF3618 domain-containing protein [Paracoccus gahaiensis]